MEMTANDTKQNNKVGGVPAKRFFIPMVLIIALLMGTLIYLNYAVNAANNELSATLRKSNVYMQDASSMLTGSNILSENALSFVLDPVAANGNTATGPLIYYGNEFLVDRRPEDVVARFEEYDVSEGAKRAIKMAAENISQMMDTQLYAISLVDTDFPVPRIEPYENIPFVKVSERDKALSPEEKIDEASKMLLGSKYLFKKQTATQFVTAAQSIIQKGIEEETAETTRQIGSLRAGMWFITVAIIVLLVITFSVIFRHLIGPLSDFVKRLNRDEELDDTTGLREVRRVASEYNEVLFRRNALDEILRSAAERDSLTGLQNRYAFESAVIEASDYAKPVGIALFDVNFLKRTNDTLGHAAGDELLRNAAYCIRKCFSQGDGNNLFRYGGDEFAAILKDISEEEIDALMKKFRLVQDERGVSVSAGYAFTENGAESDLKEMIGLADDRMYDQKQVDHAAARAAGTM